MNWVRRVAIAAAVVGVVFSSSMASAEEKKEDSKKSEQSLKHVNFRVNPLSYLVLGGIAVDVDVGILKFITIGPSYQAISIEDTLLASTKVKAKAIGASVNIYLNGKRFTDSFMLSPFFYVMPLEIEWSEPPLVSTSPTGRSAKADLHGRAYGAFLSYQWVWSPGFNITFGLGAAYYDFPSNITMQVSDGSTRNISNPAAGWMPVGQFNLGWAF